MIAIYNSIHASPSNLKSDPTSDEEQILFCTETSDCSLVGADKAPHRPYKN
jgi:hypothetical protein